jgi:flagellar FliL protein
VATKPDPDKTEAIDAEIKPGKSKKRLVVMVVVLVLVIGAAAGAWVYISKKNASEADSEVPAHVVKKTPPVFLALDNMVVNLADPGGDKVAQVGITLEVLDSKASDKVKVYLPSVRSKILLLISQRESVELLSLAGKEKLAADVLVEALRPFSAEAEVKSEGAESAKDTKVKKKAADKRPVEDSPVTGVHFYSFIVQ